MREQIKTSLKEAMKSKDAVRLSTLRLIIAAIKDRDIAARTEDGPEGVDDAQIMQILAKMIKQREESARMYEEGGRLELAEREMAEITVIREYLPKPLSDAEVRMAIQEAIAEINASSIRDMGKVMGALKAKYAGRIDFGKAGGVVKAALG